MFKKLKDEKLQMIKDSNINAALQKIEGQAADSVIDEDMLLEMLIEKKKGEAKNYREDNVVSK